jgi:hypothetical protein
LRLLQEHWQAKNAAVSQHRRKLGTSSQPNFLVCCCLCSELHASAPIPAGRN